MHSCLCRLKNHACHLGYKLATVVHACRLAQDNQTLIVVCACRLRRRTWHGSGTMTCPHRKWAPSSTWPRWASPCTGQPTFLLLHAAFMLQFHQCFLLSNLLQTPAHLIDVSAAAALEGKRTISNYPRRGCLVSVSLCFVAGRALYLTASVAISHSKHQRVVPL